MDNEFNCTSLSYAKISDRKKMRNETYQDYNSSRSFEDGYSIVALADGLGSCEKSDVGAKIAVETAIEFLHEYFLQNSDSWIDYDELKVELLNKIREEVEKQAMKERRSVQVRRVYFAVGLQMMICLSLLKLLCRDL